MGGFLLAVVAVYGCGAVIPLLDSNPTFGRRSRRAVFWCSAPAILAAPLLIPPDRIGLRALAAVLAADVTLKVLDFFDRDPALQSAGHIAYWRFLAPFPIFAVVYPDHKRRQTRPEPAGPNVSRIVAGMVGLAAALSLLHASARVERLRSDFALDHAAKLILFVLAIESISRILNGVERLAGFDSAPIVRGAYRSRTVAEFWRRYNGRVHDWLHKHVFRAAGGRRSPIRATVAVFAVSGVFHEVMFGLATSRFDGRQLAFFLLQAPAVMASGRQERMARRGFAGRVASHAMTIAFMAITSVLFFRGIARVFPFVYAGEASR